MDELHRRILQSNRSYLVNNIEDVPEIVDSLYEKEILTDGMRQDILQGEKTTVRQVRKLLDFLPKRGPFAFDTFCNVLIHNRHRHVAEHINPALVNLGARPLPPSTNQNAGQYQPAEYHQQPTGNAPPHAGGTHPEIQPYGFPQPMSIDIHKHKQTTNVSLPPSLDKKEPKKHPAYGRQPSREVNASQPEEPIQIFPFPEDWPDSLNMAPFNSRDFEVDGCTQEDVERIKRKRIYRMLSTHHGKAIIINNQSFSGQAAQFALRTSSEMDSHRLQQVLQRLSFEVHVRRDLNFDDMTQLLKRLKESDHDDAFILVILSYGGNGTIYCEDGQEMKIQDIVDTFSADNCKTLRGKPKLIFIQACGSKLKDVENMTRSQTEVDHEAGIIQGLEELSLGPQTGDVTDTNPGPDTGAVLPVDTNDTLVAMATSPDVDNTQYGSVFILALSYVICHCSKNQDLQTMLHRINQLQTDRNTGQLIKLCEVRSSLKRQLYFLPGYPLKESDPDADFLFASSELPDPPFGSTKRT